MTRPSYLTLATLAGLAAIAVAILGAECILGLKNMVYQVKLGTLAFGFTGLGLLSGRDARPAVLLRQAISLYLAGMTLCFAGLALIANVPAPAIPAEGLAVTALLLVAGLSACLMARLSGRRELAAA